MTKKTYHFDTLQLHSGYQPDEKNNARATPIYMTTAYQFHDSDHAGRLFNLEENGHIYSRINNPTNDMLEERITAMEGGAASLALSSGHAAQLIALVSILSPGDSVVSSPYLYGGTYNQFRHSMGNFGISVRFAPGDRPEDMEALIDSTTKALYVESIGNPGFSVPDFHGLSSLSKKHQIPLIVDNTFGGAGFLCRPVSHGAAIVVQSATKWIGGHGQAMGGMITDSGRFNWDNGLFPKLSDPSPSYHGMSFTEKFRELAFIAKARTEYLRDLGPCLSPFNAFLLLNGTETLSLRMQKQCDNAFRVASWLKEHPLIKEVNYPGLPGHPSHTNAKKYLNNGFGSVLSFEIKGDLQQTAQVVDNLKLISHVANVGDNKTLIIQPANTTHQQLSEEARKAAGVFPGTLRLSLGIEYISDIIGDLEQAFHHLKK
ncbi:MAG: O-acetylhomoserine aminocarboxypropyltransferase/cysteine synthase family protein [Bacteroidota bacterium]